MTARLKTAFRYPMAVQDNGKPLFWLGAFLLACPPAGWVFALGYRAEAAWHLRDSPDPALPPLPALKRGLVLGSKAVAVITAYLSPVVLLFWTLGLDSLQNACDHGLEVAAITALVPVFLPVTLPAAAFGAPMKYAWLHYTPVETAAISACFALVVFCLPAAFLQVSATRRFRSALSVPKTLTLIAESPRAYGEAWAISLAATALALCAVPVLPWAIVWSYLVIGYAFNDNTAAPRSSLKPSVRMW